MFYLRFFILSVLLAGFSGITDAQCFSFAKHVCKAELGDYIHDGNYNATILSEGETAEVYKTFYAGQGYRVAVCRIDSLPDLSFRIIDGENNILFDSKNYNNALYWDFEVETTQQLIVQVAVSEKDPDSKVKIAGCVSIMFGIKRE